MINSIKEESSSKKGSTSSSSASWLKLKDPRIVRVSRAFGGKDRHSKVCTIRGLRDRRVRLSVPTAIHLYDLQDRLGLNQPSKVVDWLLNAAKHEIDQLPPLPVTPNFALNSSLQVDSSRERVKLKNVEDPNTVSGPNFWSSEAVLMAKSKEEEKDDNNGEDGSFFQLESPIPSQQFGSHGLITAQTEDLHSINMIPSFDTDPRQVNHFQMFPTNQSVRPFHFSFNPRFHYFENNGAHQLQKGQEFRPKR